MMFRIKETGEMKELTIKDGNNGVEWTEDLLGNYGDLRRNNEEEYELTETEYKWWNTYISNKEADEKEVSEVAEEYELDESEIWDRINDLVNDLEDEHPITQNVLEEIREELKGA